MIASAGRNFPHIPMRGPMEVVRIGTNKYMIASAGRNFPHVPMRLHLLHVPRSNRTPSCAGGCRLSTATRCAFGKSEILGPSGLMKLRRRSDADAASP
eukprot:6832345-Lingulodinium_polyedra.AAC.1